MKEENYKFWYQAYLCRQAGKKCKRVFRVASWFLWSSIATFLLSILFDGWGFIFLNLYCVLLFAVFVFMSSVYTNKHSDLVKELGTLVNVD